MQWEGPLRRPSFLLNAVSLALPNDHYGPAQGISYVADSSVQPLIINARPAIVYRCLSSIGSVIPGTLSVVKAFTADTPRNRHLVCLIIDLI
jgi:hypothetical protein